MNEGKLNERKILLEVDMTNSNNQHVKPVETKIESNFYLKKSKRKFLHAFDLVRTAPYLH
jgi:hypothetical protein